MGGFAWVTLATNDSYSLGALVLAHSLKQAGTTQQLAVLITPGVTEAMREKLRTVFNVVQEVNILDSRDETNLRLLKRPELGITFTKLHCWRLTQYEKCVFLDADTLVLQNCDELFEREELSAAPDVGWPDCFNSGVFVYRPSNDTFEKLIQFALEKGSFDGGDQGLLNLYFSDWAHKDISKHLPFIYNMCSTACYSYLPAYKQFGGNAKIIHFIGSTKPWLQYFNTETRKVQPSGDSGHLQEVLQRWWDIFCSLIHPQLSPEMAGLAGAFARLTLGVARTPEQDAFESVLRKQAWEVGNIDYLGKDSFDNIWSKISETLALVPTQVEPAKEVEVPKEVSLKAGTPVPTSETPKVEVPSAPAVTDTITSPPVQTSQPLEPELPPKVEASVVTAVSATELPPPAAELKSEPHTPLAVAAEETKSPAEPVVEAETVPSSGVCCPLPSKAAEPSEVSESPKPLSETPKVEDKPQEIVSKDESIVVEKQPEVSPPAQSITEEIKPTEKQTEVIRETAPVVPIESEPSDKAAVPVVCEKPAVSDIAPAAPVECKRPEPAPLPVQEVPQSKITESVPAPEIPQSETTQPTSPPTPSTPTTAPLAPLEHAVPETPVECKKPEPVSGQEPAQEVPQSKILESTPAQDVPQSKITEPTPPVTPSTPPTAPSPQLEKIETALSVESDVPATPPPTSSQDASPTPPPRKEGKPKKSAATKPKK